MQSGREDTLEEQYAINLEKMPQTKSHWEQGPDCREADQLS